MTMAKEKRAANHRKTFELMVAELGDGAIDTTLFDAGEPPFREAVLRTTWEELLREGYIEAVETRCRLTAKGWLLAMEATDVSTSASYRERLGRLLGVMKRHVKGRKDSAIVELRKLARESGEPEGWIFNVVDSRASSAIGSARTGARWYGSDRGRLVEIPVDFNLEPIDIASALTVGHLEKIQELEQKIEEIEEDRSQFHCPHCDAPISEIASQDFAEEHCVVTYQMFECGYATEDGGERSPCPHGPNWPKEDEFTFKTEQKGNTWYCHGLPKNRRAQKIETPLGSGKTREEAERAAKRAVLPHHLRFPQSV
jgi:hypothetical protein